MKIALIGAGSIGRIHAANIATHPDAALAVVCDFNEMAAGQVASIHGGKAVVSVEAAMDAKPDAAIIASSTSSHGEVATACIAAGVPFLCEKPLAADLDTAQRIAAEAASAGIVAATAFNRRFDEGYSGIRDAISAGDIGRMNALIFTSRTASPPTVAFARTSGGLFGEKGAHFFDLARWITGEEPSEVSALGSAIINPDYRSIGQVDTAFVTMKMASGILCNFDFSWRAAYGQDERLEVNGELGMLQTIQQPVGKHLRFSASGGRHGGLMPTWSERFAPTYKLELDLFLNKVRGGSDSDLASLDDGCRAQAISDAARKSVLSGRVEAVA